MDKLVVREIETQLSLDTDILLRMLGSSQGLGATPGTSRDGRVILENTKRALRERICADEKVRATHSATSNSRVLLVAAVIDCIAGFVVGLSPITVAVLIVKEGVHSLCSETWKNG